MATKPTLSPRLQLGRAIRERFVAEATQALKPLGDVVLDRLTVLMDEPSNAKESQERRDAWMAYKRTRAVWLDGLQRTWKEKLLADPSEKPEKKELSDGFELESTDSVENKILSSKLIAGVTEKVTGPLDDLRVRIRFLENKEDFDDQDILRPSVFIHVIVDQWSESGMPADSWKMVTEQAQKFLVETLKNAYKNANDALISKGVLPKIELKDRVRAPMRAPARAAPLPNLSAADFAPDGGIPSVLPPDAGYGPDMGHGGGGYQGHSGYPQQQMPASGHGSAYGQSGHASGHSGMGPNSGAASASQNLGAGRSGFNSAPPHMHHGGMEGGAGPSSGHGAGPQSGGNSSGSTPPFWKQSGPGTPAGSSQGWVGEETRMMTSQTPLARARSKAQGIMGQIRRLFVSQTDGEFVGTEVQRTPSPALVAAISPQRVALQYATGGTLYQDYSPAGVARVAEDLREKSTELKKKAETKGEKATIEIVALMFQAILAEERIPPGIRVWFARLQMPVLRLALEDPDFFASTNHPARLLIDRMGSCVMGFDATGVQATAMEAEIKRIVQVIEQYPETGKKVYQVVYDEFQKFLAKFLTEKGTAQKVVSVAQQVEQKETLAIQYTIELRNMLRDVPVREEVREFLFKIWAEVLAVAALRKGPKHADTLALKKCAADLVWSASAKPDRADRTRVIQQLPGLLTRLRSGMTLLGTPPSEQEANIKKVSDTLADAFLSKTQAIPQEKIDAMAKRLSNLEDFISEDGMGDLPLDAESIEMMLGIDPADIEVVTNGGSKPTAAMLAWAQELELGSWFTLDHNNQVSQVQFAWRSERKHLNLFAASSGKSFLIQAGRLAAYLQAGLLLPQEEEALTVRATRTALAKLQANPERLIN